MTETVAVLVTAAGRGERFGGRKETADLSGRTVLDRAVAAFLGMPGLAALVITAPRGLEVQTGAALGGDTRAHIDRILEGRFAVVSGGESRRDSVRLGLEALDGILPRDPASPGPDPIVLVHDGARPWVTRALVERVLAGTARTGACVPVTPLVETPKGLGVDGLVETHPSRASLGAAQTPQAFRLRALLDAHRRAAAEGVECTDDAEIWARFEGPVAWVEGEISNRKITFRDDIQPARSAWAERAVPCQLRIGEGWDVHRLIPGRRLLLGGVEVPSDLGEDGHSDGDVLWHAVIDALLGAAAQGDIGTHFPVGDPEWKDADSGKLAKKALEILAGAGLEPVNLDCTVILERPRLAPLRDAIRANLAGALGMDIKTVSVKAKTKEGVDAVGEGRAVEARAVLLTAPAPRIVLRTL
ncbi:MAG TPA: 2-C-methyl-D-erythritol 2,4-cyclodiphosphate synthase [Magnetospirillaceae bacterium]|nr:2-C-methyl-D-erythritol 2,4-cyclodiphosphate synthase [Magnetospirillaceae bacterium]